MRSRSHRTSALVAGLRSMPIAPGYLLIPQPTSSVLDRLIQTFFQNSQCEVGLVAGDDERRAEADGAFSGAEDQDAALEGALDDAIAELRERLAGLLVFHQLERQHQAEPAHVPDAGE